MEEAVESIALTSGEQTVELPRSVRLWTTTDGITIISDSDSVDMMRSVNGDDLLQQAINEVSEGYERGGEVMYQHNGSILSFDNLVRIAPIDEGGSAMDTDTSCLQVGSDGSYSYISESGNELVSLANIVDQNCTSSASGVFVTSDSAGENDMMKLSDSHVETTVSDIRPSTSAVDPSAPLGSRVNPIRIIQRGNEYTSTQHLSSDQLSQILQVIQQQQLQQTDKQPSSGQTVLYNPDSQTCVVYRVLNPELQSSIAASRQGDQGISGTGIPTHDHSGRRVYRKRRKDDYDKGDGSDLSRQEKEERKKHRPRTRSGRVSRPPQYMIKDYKHIHPVDYDEDYDDSDGGYSDFKHSGDEEDAEDKHSKDDSFLEYELSGGGRLKQNKCDTCDKKYIGRGGLARHYRLNPTHGHLPDEPSESIPTDNMNSLNAADIVDSGEAIQESCEDKAVNDKEPSLVAKMSNTESDEKLSESNNVISNNTPIFETSNSSPPPTSFKKRGRGRPPIHQQGDRRKARLKEIIQQCSQAELMELVMPKLCSSANLWQFLLAMSNRGGEALNQIAEILQQYDSFTLQVKDVCKQRLLRVNEEASCSTEPHGADSSLNDASGSVAVRSATQDVPPTKLLQIDNADLARCLGLELGNYKFEDLRASYDTCESLQVAEIKAGNDVKVSGIGAVDSDDAKSFGGSDILNASSSCDVGGMLPERLELSSIATETDEQDDSKSINCGFDSFEYVLNNDANTSSTCLPKVDDQPHSSFESALFSSPEKVDLFEGQNVQSGSLTETAACQNSLSCELVSLSDNATDDVVIRPMNGSTSNDLALLADSFCSEESEAHVNQGIRSALSYVEQPSNSDMAASDEICSEFCSSKSDQEFVFTAEENKNVQSPSRALNVTSSEELDEDNLPLDAVEAFFAARDNSISSQT